MLLLSVVLGGIVASRAASRVTTMQSQSTPPPVVNLSLDDSSLAGAGTPAADTSASGEPRQIDTRPAREALAAAGVSYQDGQGLLRGVTDLAEGAAQASGVSESTIAPMTILLMGVDARPGAAIDIGVRPDSLAVLRLDPETGSCRMLNIPRDSRVDLPGYGLTKINHALAVGGIPYQQVVVEEFLDVPVDRYALIDFGGITSLVDAIGGVTVTVTESFTMGDVTFQLGEQTLSGEQALLYSRYRGGSDGDFGRIKRQQQVLRAVLRQGADLEPVDMARELLPLVEDHIRTDLNVSELIDLATRFRTSCTDQTLETMTLDGTVATYQDPIFGMPLSYVVIADDEARRKVEQLLNP